MGLSKSDESHQREFTRAIEIGQENAEYIENAQNWCKHFRIEMVSAGLFAQMSGLPIGSHSISCQYAEGCTESINLPWIIPNFIVEHCSNCAYHEPNGNDLWGKTIVENRQKQIAEQEKAKQEHQQQLEELKARLRELSSQAQKSSEIDERQILVFIEQLFEVEELKRPEIVKILVQSAKIGSDLFSSVVIDLLCEQSLSEEYSSSCLPICAELASHRSDLSERLKSVAFEAVEQNLDLELAAGLLVSLKNTIHFPLDTEVIKKLISYQKHCRYFTWNEASPSYPNIDELLLCSYDAVSESITQPLGLFLAQDEKHIRINTCGVIKSLQKRRPQIGFDLLSELVVSLDLYEDAYGESADAKAMSRIIWAFRYSPEYVDRYLLSQLSKKHPEVQELYIGIYGGLIRDRNRHWHNKDESVNKIEISVAEQIGIDRCLEFIKDESLELNVRYKAVENLNNMCFGCPHVMILSTGQKL